jgi:hypothetical protein
MRKVLMIIGATRGIGGHGAARALRLRQLRAKLRRQAVADEELAEGQGHS